MGIDSFKPGKKLGKEAQLNRLRRLLAGQTNAPAIDFQRFCVAGLDRKGQRTSGFGEVGVGVEVKGGINFGPFICPGVVTLSLDGTLSGERGGRSLVLVQRDAGRVFEGKPKRVGAAWRNRTPIAMSLLDGWSVHASLGVGAEASVGVGDPLKPDELGLSLGAKASVTGTLEHVSLSASRPMYYASAHGQDFDDDFNDLVNHKIKRAVALFLIYEKRKSRIARDTIDKFMPDSPMDGRVDQLLRAAFQQNPAVGEELDGWGYAWTFDFKNLFKEIEREIRTNVTTHGSFDPRKWTFGVSTDQLIRKLGTKIQFEYGYYVSSRAQAYKSNWQKFYAATTDEEAEEAMLEIERYQAAESIYQNLVIAKKMLERRQLAKRAGKKRVPRALDDTEKVDDKLRTSLRATVWTHEEMAGAGGKVNVSIDTVVGVGAAASAIAGVQGSWTSIIYDSATSAGVFQSGRAPKRLLSREHTVVRKLATEIALSAVAAAWAPSGEVASRTASGSMLYGTMVYQSVRACRYEGETRARTGSGVSMGTSILVKRLALVTDAIKSGTMMTEWDKETTRVKKYLCKALCVDEHTLVAFLDNVTLDWLEGDVSVLAEASFELCGGTVDFRESDLKDLRAMKPAQKRFDQSDPDTNPDRNNGSTRLQALRLRLRQTEASDKRRDIFSLGYITAVSSENPARWSFGGSIFRTYRAGVENTIDFAVRYYGRHASILNDDSNNDLAYEYGIAPVSLFNF